MSKKLVVVTGGSGFIASHIIAQLLQAGYAVRTTVRDVEKKRPLIESMLHQAGIQNLTDLSFVAADLTNEAHWDAAISGATYVIHPASPTPTLNFKNESEMIDPAIQGVLYVLRTDLRLRCHFCRSSAPENALHRRSLVRPHPARCSRLSKIKNTLGTCRLGVHRQ